MGSCLSKKSISTNAPSLPKEEKNDVNQVETTKNNVQQETLKKEIFVIKHRKSHEVVERQRCEDDEKGEGKKASEGNERGENGVAAGRDVLNGVVAGGGGVVPVRTSSCTKEEVDAILIQCGRLSRSSSTGKAGISADGNGNFSSQRGGGRRYSGSKRSFDFDVENSSEGRKGGDGGGSEDNVDDGDNEGGAVGERVHRHRQRHRHSRTPSSPSKGRRRTPSREREQGQHQQQRSGSRERGSSSNTSGSGRRVSRSPGRRSESPITTTANGNGTNSSGNANRPQKMVSVPAINNAGTEPISAAAIKRIQVKRNVGGDGSRTAASPRARSPARNNARVSNDNQNVQNQQQPMSLSRSNSRKAEQSPYRRNPLSEIDNNVVIEQRPALGVKAASNVLSQASALKTNADNVNSKVLSNTEQHKMTTEEARGPQGGGAGGNYAVNVIAATGPESLKPRRSRSLRLSRDLDINPEALTDPTPPSSYTALLLEDIQNFHQKTAPGGFALPACVTKACSILEAVADLNSSTSSNLSNTFSDCKKRNPKDGANPGSVKRQQETKEPFMESEIVAADDLMEPSFHKYVTMRRGGDMDEQESSGSNSFVGSQQHWVSSSSWEPNSADSTDRWTSSRSSNKGDDCSPIGLERANISEVDETRRTTTMVKRREIPDQQQNGIGRGRIGSRGIHTMPTQLASSSS